MTQLPLTSFYFLRHGETDWNRQRICMGTKNIPLNNVGRSQASLIQQQIQGQKIDLIVSSPLIRALETAQIINNQMELPITILDELKECSFGIVEGQPHDDGTLFQEWLNGRHPEGAESRIEFETRVINGVKKALQLSANVLIVSHGGVYATLCRIMGWQVINLNNCELIFHQAPINHAHPWSIFSLSEKADLYE
jgi:broad specificity phosphatase PhoE